MEFLYIIPVVYAKGNLPLEYRIFEKKFDYRTKFCKENCNYVYRGSVIDFVNQIRKLNLLIKDNRLIMSDGKTAFYFFRWLRNFENIKLN